MQAFRLGLSCTVNGGGPLLLGGSTCQSDGSELRLMEFAVRTGHNHVLRPFGGAVFCVESFRMAVHTRTNSESVHHCS